MNKNNVVLFILIILPIIYISLVSWAIYTSDDSSKDKNENQVATTTVVKTSLVTTTVTEIKEGIEKGSSKQEEPKNYNISET